jgi:6-phosphofructokinase 1
MNSVRAFLCHASPDQTFVLQVASYLRRHMEDVYTFEQANLKDTTWITQLNKALEIAQVFVMFVGSEFTDWQNAEREQFLACWPTTVPRKTAIVVGIAKQANITEFPDKVREGFRTAEILVDKYSGSNDAIGCAHDIIDKLYPLGITWQANDGLPFKSHLFDYEKDIIDFYVKKHDLNLNQETPNEETRKIISEVRAKLKDGCPSNWPDVRRIDGWCESLLHNNRIPKEILGEPRSHDSQVLTAALSLREAGRHGLTLREAGPREKLYFPRKGTQELNVGIVVLGGIAPGINTVIDAIVHRHWLYADQEGYSLNILGFLNGLWAFDKKLLQRTRLLRPDSSFDLPKVVVKFPTLETSEHATEGGSMLGTWREPKLSDRNTRQTFLEGIIGQLKGQDIDIIYVIGGDGSMKAAHALYNVAKEFTKKHSRLPLSVVAVPKTMDNDILWMWQTFGFSSAVQKAREIVQQLHTEVKSNPRLCILQVYGSDSGFVVSHTVLASTTGHCDLALIPEQPFNMIETAAKLKTQIHHADRPLPFGLVIMAETAVPDDALECIGEKTATQNQIFYKALGQNLKLSDSEKSAIRKFIKDRDNKLHIEGQTEDILRQACLNLVRGSLEILLKRDDFVPGLGGAAPDWEKLRVLTNEPRHLLRSTAPSTSDITMAQRLGILAVDNALAGYTDFMISQWLTEYVMIPLDLVVLGRKRIPIEGMFWKSVLAATTQRIRHRPGNST